MFWNLLNFNMDTLVFSDVVINVILTLVLGFLISTTYMKTTSSHSRNFASSLIVIPTLISIVITMVNGNQSTSIAILGAFSLVRFRSMQGTSKELSYIIFSMTLGLATGAGYRTFAILFTILICGVFFLMSFTNFGKQTFDKKELRITIPENLDYTDIFDDIFSEYTTFSELMRVKTTNLGSMYELQYHITLKDIKQEKNMIDAIRIRNGNLNIVCGKLNFDAEGL